MARKTEINVLVRGESKSRFEGAGVRIHEKLSESEAEDIENLFVLSSALQLPTVADVVTAANRRNHLRALLIEQDHDAHWGPTMLARAGLRTLRHTLVHTELSVFDRILNAWRLGAQDELIADATIQDRTLFVKNCAMDDFELPIDEIAPLRDASSDELLAFSVAEDGSHLHWPTLDVHLDLESIRVALDPDLRDKFEAQRLAYEESLGRAIKALRKEAALRQKDVEGLSARQIRRIEKGATPKTDNLELFAAAHGMELGEYLDHLAQMARRLAEES